MTEKNHLSSCSYFISVLVMSHFSKEWHKAQLLMVALIMEKP